LNIGFTHAFTNDKWETRIRLVRILMGGVLIRPFTMGFLSTISWVLCLCGTILNEEGE
jgi:hypothetical protein